MYIDFYKLKEKPFDLTPSSRYLYLGDIHKEALALLTYGVVERKGFILLTGEVGTGKTTMIHALLDNLDDSVKYIYITNPLLSQADFIKYLSRSTLSDPGRFETKTEFLFEFEAFLRNCRKENKNLILIIDEAQKLSFDLLEEIRLLSNMEDDKGKLINIFLVGQPEFNEILSEPRCRPLLQRISIRYHIKPLDYKGTEEFIITRLKKAGSQNCLKLFPKDVIKAIFHYSDGYPRMINILADNVLLLGYSRGKDRITSSMVKECYDDLQLGDSVLKTSTRDTKDIKNRATENQVLGNRWVLATLIFIIMGILGFLIGQYGKDTFKKFSDVSQLNRDASSDHSLIKYSDEKKELKSHVENGNKNVAFNDNMKKDLFATASASSFEIKNNDNFKQSESIIYKGDMNINENMGQRDLSIEIKTITVKEGDNLTKLAMDVYGNVNEKLLGLIKDHNPEIKDINLIEIGQKIDFPQSPLLDRGPTFTVHIASFKPFTHAQNLFLKLINENFEAYMIPIYDSQKGKLFRITVGNFQKRKEAKDYASVILEKGISDYARVIELNSK